jgi:hypothetical protein
MSAARQFSLVSFLSGALNAEAALEQCLVQASDTAPVSAILVRAKA